MNDTVKTYELSGGSTVTVHQPLGKESYIAIVNMKSNSYYPDHGSIARDINRTEYILVLEGSMNIIHNNEGKILNTNESITIIDGDTYRIEAINDLKALVFVKDGDGGETKVDRYIENSN